jgi:hypothetical protein
VKLGIKIEDELVSLLAHILSPPLVCFFLISAIILVCSFLIYVAYIMPGRLSTGYFHQLKFNEYGMTRSFLPHYGIWNMMGKVCMQPC